MTVMDSLVLVLTISQLRADFFDEVWNECADRNRKRLLNNSSAWLLSQLASTVVEHRDIKITPTLTAF